MRTKVEHMVGPASEPEATHVRDSDLLRVLVALAGRIAFPPERLAQIVGAYGAAYNMCTGKATLSSIARATGLDKSNLRKAIVRWEEAGAIFRVEPDGLPLRLYGLSTRAANQARGQSQVGGLPVEPIESVNGDMDDQDER